MKFLDQLTKKDLAGKKVLLRVGFDVAVENGKITDDFRIKAHKETIDYLAKNEAGVMLISHLGHKVSSASFRPIVEQIGESINQTLTLVPHSEISSVGALFKECSVLLLDNTRQDAREVENDEEFARELSAGFDYYVNDDFSTSHRKHASTVAVAKHLDPYAGFLLKKETENLSQAVNAPSIGKILILGGAKIATKIPVIKNFLDKTEKILIGGAIANNFFKARGIQIGASVADDTPVDVSDPKIILPEHIIVTPDKTGKSEITDIPLGDIASNQMIIDIGSKSAGKFAEVIREAKMVIWNGPMGLFEVEKFSNGTKIVAQAVASSLQSVVGGGDTIAAINKFNLLEKMGFVSTGGGAMLEFLAGNRLPGLEALGYYR